MMSSKTYALIALLLFFRFSQSQSLPLNHSSSNSNNSHKKCIKIERKALLELKKSLADPLGQLSTWKGFNCCEWAGITCNNLTRHIIKLDLRNRHTKPYIPSGLGGTPNPSLLNLKHLTYLDLSRNDFHRIQIPSFLGSFKRLTYLNLSYTRFEGMVPPQFGNLSNLQYLDLITRTLWSNDLRWISGLGSLEYIDLSGVNLSKVGDNWLKPFTTIPSLKELHLRFCNLSNHSSPNDIPIMNLTALSVIDLSGNFFDSVPQWLFNMSSLKQLGLLRSNIKGPISHFPWRDLCKLEVLYLSHNSISDDIGKFLGALSECSNASLQRLTLQNNRFTGELGTLVYLKNLRSLRLYDNLVSGPIPPFIGNLHFLEELELSFNKMNGSIPESIGTLDRLNHLDIENNLWEGALTENHFHNLKKLEILSISSSSEGFIFDLSKDWVPQFDLRDLVISDCNLGPEFPPWLITQKKLSSIVLRNVKISKIIPDWFWKLAPQIKELDLSSNRINGVLPKTLNFSSAVIVDLRHNRLQGSVPLWSHVPRLFLGNNSFQGIIPLEIGNAMSSLRVLDLSCNFINGSIPPSISEMKNLVSLDLSENHISGEIPHNTLEFLSNLRRLDLSSNNLYGNIPSSICSLQSLSWLKMNGNKLSGTLSSFLTNCTSLEKIDLGDNRLSGSIPSWFGERLPSLKVLSLRSNSLSGEIPYDLCRLSGLHALDLSNNSFSGTIPTCLEKLSGLYNLAEYNQLPPYLYYTYVAPMDFVVKGKETEFTLILDLVNIIDLSNNNLWGEIPVGITRLITLGTLNLSRNQFTGNIPENIGELQRLETLDLSCNHLSGQIPSSMSSITSLSHLNLSFNNLSGPIPLTNQFSTFNESIFEGNPGLCGPPLATKCFDSGKHDYVKSGNDEDDENFWFYVSMGIGFFVGLGGYLGAFLVSESSRNGYFGDMVERIAAFFVSFSSYFLSGRRRLYSCS